ncbi:MAG: hypothetical protein ABJF04_07080 [Reichenbachiella sp.]|uniref:hypothetical protein n=1 Tax=Reichenbachiella sp. TaxID=2184521 RepID=UPI003262F24A
MNIINKLSSSHNRRDQLPNQELAEEIVNTADRQSIKELVSHLSHKNKAIQNDCIKVLYEIGEQNPQLISEYFNDFVQLLDSSNNRLQWGAMTALNAITLEVPTEVFDALIKILDTAERGSIITKDHAVGILIKLCSVKQFADHTFSLLMELLLKSSTNQLPMYAERALPAIAVDNKALFIRTLNSRLNEIEKESKRKRVEKVIRKASLI